MSKYTKKAIFQMRLKSITYKRDPSVFCLPTAARHEYNKFPTHYALFFFYEKKACQERTYRTEVVFEDKNFETIHKFRIQRIHIFVEQYRSKMRPNP